MMGHLTIAQRLYELRTENGGKWTDLTYDERRGWIAAAKWVEEMFRDLATPAIEPAPIPMQLWCPMCHTRHIDEGDFATKPHATHACQNPRCCLVWKPAQVPTVGVWDLPGYLNKPTREQWLARQCPICGAVGHGCIRLPGHPLTTGDHDAEFHEERRPS